MAWPTTAGNTKQEAEDMVRNGVSGSSSQPGSAQPLLTIHGRRRSSAHAPVLDLVHRLRGSLSLLLPLGWHRGRRGWRGSALRG